MAATTKAQRAKLEQRLAEVLEQQAATAGILHVIRSSPANLKPVLDAVVKHAARLCDARNASIFRVEGTLMRRLAFYGFAPMALKIGQTRPLNRGSVSGRAILERRAVHVRDVRSKVDSDFPELKAIAKRDRVRTLVGVPLLRDGKALGAITVYRREVRPFTRQQIALLKIFADQAVIAIENVRLFNETKEALERQTATTEILRVISSSPADLQPTFQTILASATRLCEAHLGLLYRYDGEAWTAMAFHGASRAFVDFLSRGPLRPGPKTALARLVIEQRPIHMPDIIEDAAYEERDPLRVAQAELGGARTLVAVPMHKENELVGAIVIYRPEVRPFNEKQIELLKTFAEQAVIAIENVRLFNETKEALERQTATAEILKVISSSPTDVQPVFEAIARNALALCGSSFANVFRYDGKLMHYAASHQVAPEQIELVKRRFPAPPDKGRVAGRAILSKSVVCIEDALADPDYDQPVAVSGGWRRMFAAPMLREGEPLGAIAVGWTEPGPIPKVQEELLKTFADQAAIAIENVRLFNETKEALEWQTATAEILQVISGSPTDTQPVFDAILQSATRLCDTDTGILFRYEEQAYHALATRIPNPEFAAVFKEPRRPGPTSKTGLGRIAREKRLVHIPDLLDDDAFREGDPLRLSSVAGGMRTWLGVPMLKEGELIGAIVLYRKEVRQFSEQQISLLQTFADQAVIAIENVRLFNETKEALERQTATADILKVISGSPTDVQPVFDAIVRSAVRLCNSSFGFVFRFDGAQLHVMAHKYFDPELFEMINTAYPMAPSPDQVSGRAILGGTVAEVPDTENDSRYRQQMAKGVGYRSTVGIPMLRDGVPLGVIVVAWEEPSAYTPKQIDLLKTFADQAVIAIENVRLFKELEARTAALTRSVGQLTALGEVGQAISSTLDLETVLKTIVSRAIQLSGLEGGSIYEFDERDEMFHLRAAEGIAEEILDVYRRDPIRLGEGAVGRAGAAREPVLVPDVLDESYQSRVRELLIKAGSRALLAVPLLREDHLLGALVVNRRTPGAFEPEIVELMKTFATQSALAIQNARLFREIAEKSRQLEVASRHKSDFLASMSHELRTPLNAILGFNEMLLGQVYGEVPADMKEPLEDIQKSGKHLLRLINNVLDLAKIEAGRMELALADYSVPDTVESVRASLRPLAAEKGLEFAATVPPDIPLAFGDAGRITQCLMNLAGNALKFTKQGRVEISVALNDGRLVYRVADTGIGIPKDKIDTVFSEFRQSDATIASEYGGTGLGLSISKKFVEMHRGRIWVESEPGKGSAFSFEIPLRLGQGAAA